MYKIINDLNVLLLVLCLVLILSEDRILELSIRLCFHRLWDHISDINITYATINILLDLLRRVHILETNTTVMIILYSTTAAIQYDIS